MKIHLASTHRSTPKIHRPSCVLIPKFICKYVYKISATFLFNCSSCQEQTLEFSYYFYSFFFFFYWLLHVLFARSHSVHLQFPPAESLYFCLYISISPRGSMEFHLAIKTHVPLNLNQFISSRLTDTPARVSVTFMQIGTDMYYMARYVEVFGC